MSSQSSGIHLIAGGVGGTVGAVITCPLEVVKTRLQSSVATFQPVYIQSNVAQVNLIPNTYLNINGQLHVHTDACNACRVAQSAVSASAERALLAARRQSFGLFYCLRYVFKNEGFGALFKGLGPNLVGVAPSRAIYFFCYANTKNFLNQRWTPDTPVVHIAAAVSAGLTSSTATNPIWLIKTRLQLDQKRNNSLTTTQCIRSIYATNGIKGFYKGMTASYVGVTETVIHFVLYEALKAKFLEMSLHSYRPDNERMTTDFVRCMIAGAISKTTATCIAYPHEVVRTRLREEGSRYRSFFQTLILVGKEEGARGLYRGLPTQLVRQIPNTAVMMGTYELVVKLHHRWKKDYT